MADILWNKTEKTACRLASIDSGHRSPPSIYTWKGEDSSLATERNGRSGLNTDALFVTEFTCTKIRLTPVKRKPAGAGNAERDEPKKVKKSELARLLPGKIQPRGRGKRRLPW